MKHPPEWLQGLLVAWAALILLSYLWLYLLPQIRLKFPW